MLCSVPTTADTDVIIFLPEPAPVDVEHWIVLAEVHDVVVHSSDDPTAAVGVYEILFPKFKPEIVTVPPPLGTPLKA